MHKSPQAVHLKFRWVDGKLSCTLTVEKLTMKASTRYLVRSFNNSPKIALTCRTSESSRWTKSATRFSSGEKALSMLVVPSENLWLTSPKSLRKEWSHFWSDPQITGTRPETIVTATSSTRSQQHPHISSCSSTLEASSHMPSLASPQFPSTLLPGSGNRSFKNK